MLNASIAANVYQMCALAASCKVAGAEAVSMYPTDFVVVHLESMLIDSNLLLKSFQACVYFGHVQNSPVQHHLLVQLQRNRL